MTAGYELAAVQRREFGDESWETLIPTEGRTLGWIIESVIEDVLASPALARREINHATPPRAFQPGDVVDHPEHGRGFVYNASSDRLVVRFLEGVRPLAHVTDGLTLVLPAPAPPVVKPDEPQRLGSVVRDGDDVWVLVNPGSDYLWFHVGEYDWHSWDDIPDTVTIERGDDE